MNAYEAFLAGIKPAYFSSHDETHLQHLRDSGFPSVELKKGIITLFFNSEELKNQFLIDFNGASLYTKQYFIAVGKALGYPPIAFEFFPEYMSDRKSLEPICAGYQYAGRSFVGRFDDAIPIAEWLWQNVPIPPAEVKLTTPQGDEYIIQPCSKKLIHVRKVCDLSVYL